MQESAGVNTNDAQTSGNTKSYFSALSSMVSIAGSEWSFAQFRLDPKEEQHDSESDMHSIIKNGVLHVITTKGPGHYLKGNITKEGGNLEATECHKFHP